MVQFLYFEVQCKKAQYPLGSLLESLRGLDELGNVILLETAVARQGHSQLRLRERL